MSVVDDIGTVEQAELVRWIRIAQTGANAGTGQAAARAAEAELCRRFAPRIRLYGLKHLRDEDRARELVQVVLVAVIVAMREGRIEEPEHADRFVLGTCRNLALRMRDDERRVQPSDEIDLGSVVPSFEVLDIQALLPCLAVLDVRARTVLQLSFYNDKSADEIAAVLETSAGNVRVVRHRAMAQLRDCMEGAA
jgi:RNA polymerase sigma-70 factor, ECF subfamily